MDVWKKHINAVFDGRYQIKDTIGVGGMAVVYEAIDLKTGETVALKMLKESISDNPQALRRFYMQQNLQSRQHRPCRNFRKS